jgi:hypothetical protein
MFFDPGVVFVKIVFFEIYTHLSGMNALEDNKTLSSLWLFCTELRAKPFSPPTLLMNRSAPLFFFFVFLVLCLIVEALWAHHSRSLFATIFYSSF